jgi:hypothetical protein
MQYRRIDLFPTTVLVVKDDIFTNDDIQSMTNEIDYVIDQGEYMQWDELTVREQCKPVLWRKDTPWYSSEYNPCWDRLRVSFQNACGVYLQEVQHFVKKADSVFFTHARAWFYKSWYDLNTTQENPAHDHSFALLTGVYYLKIPGFDPESSGTEVFDPRFENAESSRSYAVAGQQGTWSIFPGWMKHRSMRTKTNDPRYVIACDAFAASY